MIKLRILRREIILDFSGGPNSSQASLEEGGRRSERREDAAQLGLKMEEVVRSQAMQVASGGGKRPWNGFSLRAPGSFADLFPTSKLS